METVTEDSSVEAAGVFDTFEVLARVRVGDAFRVGLTNSKLGSALVTIVVLSVSVDAAARWPSSAAQSIPSAWKTSVVGMASRGSNMVLTVVTGTMTRFVWLGVADALACEEVWESSREVKIGITREDEEGATGVDAGRTALGVGKVLEGRTVLGVGKENWESLTRNEVWDGSTAVDELAIKVDMLLEAQGVGAAEPLSGLAVELKVGK
jgi:hypothetical protein